MSSEPGVSHEIRAGTRAGSARSVSSRSLPGMPCADGRASRRRCAASTRGWSVCSWRRSTTRCGRAPFMPQRMSLSRSRRSACSRSGRRPPGWWSCSRRRAGLACPCSSDELACASGTRALAIYDAGSKSSTGLPSGSSKRICFPPGPMTTSFRNRMPASFISRTRAGRSRTSMTSRFHPPGSGRRPSGMGRAAELFGPASHRVRSSRETLANAGRISCSSLKPRCCV